MHDCAYEFLGDFNINSVGLIVAQTPLPVFTLQHRLDQLCSEHAILGQLIPVRLPESRQQFLITAQILRRHALPAMAKLVERDVVGHGCDVPGRISAYRVGVEETDRDGPIAMHTDVTNRHITVHETALRNKRTRSDMGTYRLNSILGYAQLPNEVRLPGESAKLPKPIGSTALCMRCNSAPRARPTSRALSGDRSR